MTGLTHLGLPQLGGSLGGSLRGSLARRMSGGSSADGASSLGDGGRSVGSGGGSDRQSDGHTSTSGEEESGQQTASSSYPNPSHGHGDDGHGGEGHGHGSLRSALAPPRHGVVHDEQAEYEAALAKYHADMRVYEESILPAYVQAQEELASREAGGS